MKNLAPTFPKARLDAMMQEAKNFDPRKFAAQSRWRWDGEWHQDAAESAFVARQLEFLRPGVIEASFPELKASRLIPFNTTVDNGSEDYTVTYETQVGEVRVTRDMKGIIPRVDIATSQDSVKIFSMMLAYGYSIQDARAAIKAGVALIPHRAMRCREQMERKLDDIAFIGELTTGIKGLLNQSGTATYTTPATGTGASKTWESKEPDAVLLDLNAAPSQVVTASLEIEVPNTLLLPLTSREHIAARRIGDGTTESILSYYMRTTAHIKQIESSHKSESHATAWTGKRAVAYQKNPTRIEMIVPQPFEQFAPTSEGLEVVTNCHMRTAGVVVHRPKSVIYMDGI